MGMRERKEGKKERRKEGKREGRKEGGGKRERGE